jgi:hypothetical protein
MTPSEVPEAADVVSQVALLRGLADDGSATAAAIIGWFEQTENWLEIKTEPGQSELLANTAQLFYKARLLKHQSLTHRDPGLALVTIEIDWLELE